MEEVSFIEYEFQVKDIDIEIQTLEAQLARLQLEKDKLYHQKIMLANAYREYLTSNESLPKTQEVEHQEQFSEVEEFKPRRLKK